MTKTDFGTNILGALVCTFLMAGCNTGSFSGANKKIEQPDRPRPSSQPEPTSTPVQDNTLGGTSNGEDLDGDDRPSILDNIPDKPDPVVIDPGPIVMPPPPPAVTPTPTPVVVATPTPTPTPGVVAPPTPTTPPETPPSSPPPVTENEVGALTFSATPFVNMEHGIHATDAGTWALFKDGSGKIIGAGPMTLDAACRGQMNSNFGYPDVTLNVALTYVAPEVETGSASGGQGTLSICLVNDPNAHPSEHTCKQGVQGAGDASRPAHWHDRSFSYSVNGNTIAIDNKAGFAVYGGSEGVQNGLTYAHPTAAGVCGSSTPQYADYNSPLVLDMNKNGQLDLVSAWDDRQSIRFDLKADGKPLRTGWVAPGDALLVHDANSNGLIDDGSELFGEHTVISFKDVEAYEWSNFKNGFKALGQYDRNYDGVIDARDKIFAELKLWFDRNQNGRSDPGELQAITASDIQKISLAYYKTGKPYEYLFVKGNEIRLMSTYRDKAGKDHQIGDVWFGVRKNEMARKESH